MLHYISQSCKQLQCAGGSWLTFYASSVNNAKCCHWKSVALNAAEMRAIYSTVFCTRAESRGTKGFSARCGCKLHMITHIQMDVTADVREAVDAVAVAESPLATICHTCWPFTTAYLSPLTVSCSRFLSDVFSAICNIILQFWKGVLSVCATILSLHVNHILTNAHMSSCSLWSSCGQLTLINQGL